MADKTMRATVAETRRASQTVAGTLEDVRLRLVRAKERRGEIERAPVSKAEALERVRTWADDLAAAGFARVAASRFTEASFRPPAGADAAELVLGLSAQNVASAIGARVEASYGKTDGLAAAERSRQLDDIEAQILDLELAEESIIRSAEAAGMDLMRRADADPRAVLATSEAMP